MVEIGGRPMLWHVMNIYSTYGLNEFVIALGFKGEVIKDYFTSYYRRQSNLTVDLRNGQVEVSDQAAEDWIVQLVDTGLQTGTGGRIKRLASSIRGATFLMTYGDGVANVDVSDLVAFHRKHGKLATVTAVRPPARFGRLDIEEKMVRNFVEKPQGGEGWINGGFFVLEPGVLDYIDGDETMFEREPLFRLARDGQLAAYQHHEFWQAMDTLRDVRLLRRLWDEGSPPWKVPAR